jgi:hypothetical protein
LESTIKTWTDHGEEAGFRSIDEKICGDAEATRALEASLTSQPGGGEVLLLKLASPAVV